MRIDILTLFEMFDGALSESMVKRARQNGLVDIHLVDIRDFTADRHRKVDDKPYGGGAGMVLQPEPIFKALAHILKKDLKAVIKKKFGKTTRVVLLTPQGRRLDQEVVKDISKYKNIVLICGHYEGFDERIRNVVTDQISIGDYILTGGEIPAMVMVDALTRLLPGVLGNEKSAPGESFEDDLLEHPHYTRPAVYCGMKVPDVLLSGRHQDIAAWRKKEALRRTQKTRPDLLTRVKKGKKNG